MLQLVHICDMVTDCIHMCVYINFASSLAVHMVVFFSSHSPQ